VGAGSEPQISAILVICLCLQILSQQRKRGPNAHKNELFADICLRQRDDSCFVYFSSSYAEYVHVSCPLAGFCMNMLTNFVGRLLGARQKLRQKYG
jgi:hypothetical protein